MLAQQSSNVLGWLGSRKQEALGTIAAEGLQLRRLSLRFDAFTDDIQAERPGEGDDAVYDSRVLDVIAQTLDE